MSTMGYVLIGFGGGWGTQVAVIGAERHHPKTGIRQLRVNKWRAQSKAWTGPIWINADQVKAVATDADLRKYHVRKWTGTERDFSSAPLAIGLLLLALASGAAGCSAHATAPEAESVGTLAAGPSVWHAPTHEATPPPTVELAGPADDDTTEVATTVVRADGGEPDAAPEVTVKGAGLELGGAR